MATPPPRIPASFLLGAVAIKETELGLGKAQTRGLAVEVVVVVGTSRGRVVVQAARTKASARRKTFM
jgi:hypothetical protein